MSTELLELHGVFVTRFAGPASEGEDRRRWQLTIPGEYVQLDAERMRELLDALAALREGMEYLA